MPTLTELVKANTDARAVGVMDYAALGAGFQNAPDRKVLNIQNQDRIFILNGAVQKSPSGPIAANTLIATFAVENLPAETLYFSAFLTGSNAADQHIGLFSLATNGELRCLSEHAQTIYRIFFNASYIK